MGGGLGAGFDIEAAEETMDALVGEATLAEEADFVVQGGVNLGFGGGDEAQRGSSAGKWLGGVALRLWVRHRDFAFLLRR